MVLASAVLLMMRIAIGGVMVGILEDTKDGAGWTNDFFYVPGYDATSKYSRVADTTAQREAKLAEAAQAVGSQDTLVKRGRVTYATTAKLLNGRQVWIITVTVMGTDFIFEFPGLTPVLNLGLGPPIDHWTIGPPPSLIPSLVWAPPRLAPRKKDPVWAPPSRPRVKRTPPGTPPAATREK